jgi:hypothetical protein
VGLEVVHSVHDQGDDAMSRQQRAWLRKKKLHGFILGAFVYVWPILSETARG